MKWQKKIKINQEEFLDEFVQQDDLQKQTYGERIVYHENTFKGQTAVKVVNKFVKFEKEHPVLILLFFGIVGIVSTTITWPRDVMLVLKDFITKKAS